jgi:DNA-binding NarL/FixJ family response regulator/tetratricopeptide (TPR) repeat protein
MLKVNVAKADAEQTRLGDPLPSSGLRWPQRAQLMRSLERAAAGSGVLVWLHGPRGTGKTFIAREVLHEAENRGFRVAYTSGRSFPSESTTELLRDLIEQLGDFDASAWASVLRAAKAAVETAARAHPVAVVIDAIELLTDDEAALVETLLRSPPRGQVIVVLVMQDRPSPLRRERELEHLAIDAGCARVLVSNLRRPETQALVEGWIAPLVPSPEFIDDVQELTGGNLHYLTALREGLSIASRAERQRIVEGLSEVPIAGVLPEDVQLEVAGLLREVGHDAALCLRGIAAWGGGLAIGDLATVTGLREGQVIAALRPLVDAGLLRFTHADSSDSLIGFVDPVLLRLVDDHATPLSGELHRRCAAVKEASAEQADEVKISIAHHYSRARLDELSDQARDSILTGARLLARQGRYRRAKQLLEHVLSSSSGGTDRVLDLGTIALMGSVYARFGRDDQITRLLSGRSDDDVVPSPDERSQLVRWQARRLVDGGQDERAFELLIRALQNAPVLSTEERANLESDIVKTAFQSNHVTLALALADMAAQRSHQAELHELEATSLVSKGSVLWRQGRPGAGLEVGRRAASAARVAESPRAMARARTQIGLSYIDLGNPQKGERWLNRAIRGASAVGDRSAQSIAGRALAQVRFELGAWDAAMQSARLTTAIDDGLFRTRQARRSHAFLTELRVRKGLVDDEAAPPGQAGSSPTDVMIAESLARSVVLERQGRAEEALSLLGELDAAVSHDESATRELTAEVLPRRATLATDLEANEVIEQIEARLQVAAQRERTYRLLQFELTHVRGLASFLKGDSSAAANSLGIAADGFEGAGFRWREARARLYEGLAFTAAGDVANAAESLARANAAFQSMGAPAELARTEAALHAIGRRAPGPRSDEVGTLLTAREFEVAVLAADGLTNREIAARLSISPRTVTTHVHNILRKTELRSRVQLGDYLASIDASDALSA